MSDSATRGARMRTPHSLWPVILMNAVLGVPAYFISFVLAYGFRDVVGLTEHLTFLTLVTIFAVVAGLISAALPTGRPEPAAARRAAFGVLMSLALNSAAVGLGSVVSAAHKEEGSVSARFTTTTDVLIAVGFLVLAAALGLAARARRLS